MVPSREGLFLIKALNVFHTSPFAPPTPHHRVVTFASVRRRADSGAQGLEHRPRFAKKVPRDTWRKEALHHGWCADCRLGFDFDSAVGAPLKSLHLDRNRRDCALCRHWIHGRLRQDGEAAESWLNGSAEVDLSIPDRIGCLDGTFYFDQVPRQRLFLECQHPV